MKRNWSHLGQVPAWAKFCLGNSASQTQQTENQQQVAAEEGVGIGAGAKLSGVSVNITTADVPVTEAALEANTTVATTAINDVSAASLDAEDIAAGEVDQVATTYAQQSELQSEETAQSIQAAEQIAANAAPQTQAAQQEILSGTGPLAGNGSISSGTWILIGIAALGLFYTLSRHK